MLLISDFSISYIDYVKSLFHNVMGSGGILSLLSISEWEKNLGRMY